MTETRLPFNFHFISAAAQNNIIKILSSILHSSYCITLCRCWGSWYTTIILRIEVDISMIITFYCEWQGLFCQLKINLRGKFIFILLPIATDDTAYHGAEQWTKGRNDYYYRWLNGRAEKRRGSNGKWFLLSVVRTTMEMRIRLSSIWLISRLLFIKKLSSAHTHECSFSGL